MPHRCVGLPEPPSAEPTAACRIIIEALSNTPLGCFWGDRHAVDSAELSQKTGGTLQALELYPIAMTLLATVRVPWARTREIWSLAKNKVYEGVRKSLRASNTMLQLFPLRLMLSTLPEPNFSKSRISSRVITTNN